MQSANARPIGCFKHVSLETTPAKTSRNLTQAGDATCPHTKQADKQDKTNRNKKKIKYETDFVLSSFQIQQQKKAQTKTKTEAQKPKTENHAPSKDAGDPMFC